MREPLAPVKFEASENTEFEILVVTPRASESERGVANEQVISMNLVINVRSGGHRARARAAAVHLIEIIARLCGLASRATGGAGLVLAKASRTSAHNCESQWPAIAIGDETGRLG